MDYGFVFHDRVCTPNGTPGIQPAENDARNARLQAEELKHWNTQPDRFIGYYDDKKGIVSTWLGTPIGTIARARIYRHNFGGRCISLRLVGTNGASYFGRTSYDNGNVIRLRRSRS